MIIDKIIESRFEEIQELIPIFALENRKNIIDSARIIIDVFGNNGKLLICGNGGSAADSQHLAAEFVSSFSKDISRNALSAISLSSDTSILTAYSNDFEFENVFARQVEAHGRKDDVLIAFSTSGNSKNCLMAVQKAKEINMKTISFSKKGGKINTMTDVGILVPSNNTQHIQECHIIAYHIITEIVESQLYKKEL